MQAQYPVKVQAIRSKGRPDRFYVVIPTALAAAISLQQGEPVQWSLDDLSSLHMLRVNPPKISKSKPKS
jgi:hypothetical protein